jgi:aminopeptidase YwaD
VGPLAEPSLIEARSISLRIIIAVLATLLVVVAACSDDDGESESTPTTAASASPSPTRKPTASPSPVPTADPNFSSARALEHVRQLSALIGSRPAGSAAEASAAEYIRGQLAGFGYQASNQEFQIDVVTDTGTGLTLVPANGPNLSASALGGSADGHIEAPIVAAGIGRVEDFPPDTTGKVALIERGELTFGMKVANAAGAGAAGVIVYNNQPGAFNGQLSSRSSIPAATVSREDGQSLLGMAPVTVRLDVRTVSQTLPSYNVVAKPPDGTCQIVVGGHLDSVPAGPGANDNASGTSVVIEMARTRAARGQIDGVCYVLFGSEEIGLVGSAHYVESLTAAELEALEAMLNFDMLGVGDTWPLIGSPSLTSIAVAEAQEIGVPYSVSGALPENLGSDHSNFIARGVPSIIFNCFCDPNYHTAGDKFELVEEPRLGEAGAIGLGMIEQLLAS